MTRQRSQALLPGSAPQYQRPTRGRSNGVFKTGPDGMELSLASRLLEDAYGKVASTHGKWYVRFGHTVGHMVHNQVQYNVKHKLYNEKGLTALQMGISGGIVVVSAAGGLAITAGTKGIATPLALAGLAAGTWAANQVADVVVDLVRNQYRQKRMRGWLEKYPKVRQTIDKEADKLMLIQDSCDAIRRAVDHYRKACDAARDIAHEIQESKYCDFTNCSELTAVVKRQMKWIHEVQKTERYLVPAIDLAILLKNTQAKLCDSWAQLVPAYRDQMAAYLFNGDHSSCGDICYASKGGGVPEPCRPLAEGPNTIPNGIMRFGEHAEKLQLQLEGLIELREVLTADLTGDFAVPEDVNTAAKQRFDQLLQDAAAYYDKPGQVRRTAHYISNAWTRRTKGELISGGVTRGVNLVVGVGTSGGGSAFGTHVVTPFVTTPINGAIQASQMVVVQLQNSAQNGLVMLLQNVINDVITDATATVVSKGTGALVNSSVTGSVKLAGIGVKLATPFIANKTVDKAPKEVSDVGITASGKDIGDNIFKKSVRHLLQAEEAYEKLTKQSHTLRTCEDALAFGKLTGEFIWHLKKSIERLDQALQLVHHMSTRVTEWNALEPQLWAVVQKASLHYLGWKCGSCACKEKNSPLASSTCYDAGQQPGVPKRRIVNY